jgi:hypothetical protein
MNAEVPSFDPQPDDDRLDRLLRADAARDAYVEDAGFTAAVMAALPPPRPLRSYSWIGPLLGAVAAVVLVCFSPLLGNLAGSLQSAFDGDLLRALHGHLLPVQSLLLLAPLLVMVYGSAWFAAADSR